MKNTIHTDSPSDRPEDMLDEYRFDYAKARPNRFADKIGPHDRLVVVLDPDVSAVFTSTESVNDALRSVISTKPEKAKTRTAE